MCKVTEAAHAEINELCLISHICDVKYYFNTVIAYTPDYREAKIQRTFLVVKDLCFDLKCHVYSTQVVILRSGVDFYLEKQSTIIMD